MILLSWILAMSIHAQDCPCPSGGSAIDGIMSQADDAFMEVVKKITPPLMPEPSTDLFEDCVLNMGSFGFSFGFSLSDFLSGICETLISELTNFLEDSALYDSIMGELGVGPLNLTYGAGVNLGDAILETPPITIEGDSNEVLKEIQDAIDNAGKVTEAL